MRFFHNDKEYQYPTSLSEITLEQQIASYNLYGAKYFENKLKAENIEDIEQRELEENRLYEELATQSFSFFTGIDIKTIKEVLGLPLVLGIYTKAAKMLYLEETEIALQSEYLFNNEKWVLPNFETTPRSLFSFNEFLVSKENVRQLVTTKQSAAQILLYLSCIFLRKPGESFNEAHIEQGPRMELFKNLTLDIATAVGVFFKHFNDYILKHFTVFKKSSVQGVDLTKHFEQFGWVSFLSFVAESKMFDISGKNSIDSAKSSKLYEVLVWSSEKKNKEEAIAQHFDQQQK